MGMQKVGKWGSYGRMLTSASASIKRKSDQIIAKAASGLASDIKRNLVSGGSFAGVPFAPLTDETIAAKGSSKPLLDHGDLLKSVVSKKLKASPIAFLVGIPGDVKSKKGGVSVAVYARAHEFGAITKKGKVIKKRPFIWPTIEKTHKKRIAEIDKEFKKIFEF
ncbi:MAG: hypothetical protein V3T43_02855 [Nitrosomonadaceae bacterium]